MKTLKTIIASLLIFTSLSGFAKEENDVKNEKLTINYAVKTYVDAVTSGKVDGVHEIFDKDVKFTSVKGTTILTASRSEMMDFLRSLKGIEQNCTTDSNILDLTGTNALIKVTMRYKEFNKVNFLTMTNTTKGWKITNVSTAFD